MKKINNFFDNGKLWKVFLVCLIFFSSILSVLFYVIFSNIPELSSTFIYVKMGMSTGMIISITVLLGIIQSRKSTKFWKEAERIEEAVRITKSLSELKSLYETDFYTLRKLVSSPMHITKLREIYILIETKAEFLI